MANLTITVDDGTLKRARMRALQEDSPSTRSCGSTWRSTPGGDGSGGRRAAGCWSLPKTPA